MSTYLVLKRMVADRTYLPDELIENPDAKKLGRIDLLMQRGYLQPVPDNFTPASSSPGTVGAAEDDDSSDETKSLLSNNRGDLDKIAQDAGVEDPGDLPNKQAVVDAIYEARAAKADTSEGAEADAMGARAQIKGLSDEDLDEALEIYEVTVDEDADREAKEKALEAYAVANPEDFDSE